MKYWTSLSLTNEDQRWKTLSQEMTKVGVANEYVPWEGPVDALTFAELEKFHHIRLSGPVGHQLLQQVKVQSSWVTLLGVIDGMVRTEHGWWPLCGTYESFGALLFQLGANVDRSGGVLVAGGGDVARVAIAAFFKNGFRNFLLTSFDAQEAQETIRDVNRRFFGLNLQWLPVQKIVLLPGESSVLINCTPGTEENGLLVELSYMNFLKRPGFLFDISRSSPPSMLVQEAKDAGVNVISGFQIAAHTDILWGKWAFGAELKLENYLPVLESSIG